MKRIDPVSLPARRGSGYPAPFDHPCRERLRRALADPAGLTDFGVNLLTLPPGAWSSQRHWHSAEDEFIYVLDGEVTLVTDAGEETLRRGECAAFKAGEPSAHHLQNRSGGDASILEVGARRPGADAVEYADIDLFWSERGGYTHKDGRPY